MYSYAVKSVKTIYYITKAPWIESLNLTLARYALNFYLSSNLFGQNVATAYTLEEKTQQMYQITDSSRGGIQDQRKYRAACVEIFFF
jgi:hypothetical protein